MNNRTSAFIHCNTTFIAVAVMAGALLVGFCLETLLKVGGL